MERIVIIGNDRFAAGLAEACLRRGMQPHSVLLDEGARRDFELLGHEVKVVSSLHELDGGMRNALVSPYVIEWREQTNWVWLKEAVSGRGNEWVVGRLLDPLNPPNAATLTADAPVAFADFAGQIQSLANQLQTLQSLDQRDHAPLETALASASEVAATAHWITAGDPGAPLEGVAEGPWKAWWNRNGFGLHAVRPATRGMPQAIWHVPGIRADQAMVFAPGYKGFSLWGAWSSWAQKWASLGWQFQAVDFSCNGTTARWPRAIHDEDAWSRNAYSKEADELTAWVVSLPRNRPLVLVGHSRGAVSTLCAARAAEARGMQLKAVVLLAPVARLRDRFPSGDALELWRTSDRLEVRNARTGQVLVHPFRFYEDFIEHEDALDPLLNARALQCPLLVYHAEDDAAVSPDEGRQLAATAPKGRFHALTLGGHTMGTKEPWHHGGVSPELHEITASIANHLT